MNCARVVPIIRRLLCLGTLTAPALFAPQSHAQYCAAGSVRCDAGIPRISRVTFVAIDNPEGNDIGPVGCYTDYTALSTNVFVGGTYPITVYDPNTNLFNGNAAAVWFDWDHDSNFNAGNEQYVLITSNGGSTWTANVTVPGNALLGATRMRVRYWNSGPLSPCGNSSLGEVEDYSVTVVDNTFGACCTGTGTCNVVDPSACFGIFQGGGVACVPTNPCGGACCSSSGTCSVVATSAGCLSPNSFVSHAACTPISCFGVCCDLATGVCAPSGIGVSGCPCGTTWLGISSVCTPSPCQQGACCVTITGVCSLTPQVACSAGSIFQGVGSMCAPTNPCGGACCTTATGVCTAALNVAACTAGTQTFVAGGLCSALPCTGQACCNATTGACTFSGTTACAAGTVTRGAGTLCIPNLCPSGACCSATTGACTLGGTACAAGLTYQGLGLACTADVTTLCGIPSACCGTTGACTLTLSAGCVSPSTFQNGNLSCTPAPCNRGACCTNAGACTNNVLANCASPSTFQLGVTCGTNAASCSQGACCDNNSAACTLTISASCGAGFSFNGSAVCSPSPCNPGACCSVAGTCTLTTMAGCTGTSTYLGDGSLCYTTATPCGTGACCHQDGTCTVSNALTCSGSGFTYLGSNIACPAVAIKCYAELEPNDTRLTATVVPAALADGDMVVGFSTGISTVAGFGVSTVDYFSVRPTARASGIYRHTLTIAAPGEPADGTAGHNMISRGLGQADSVTNYKNTVATADAAVQTTNNAVSVGTPARTLVWYGFGNSEIFDFLARWSGTIAASPYTATLSTTSVAPNVLGSFPAGLITVSTVGQGHTTDTSFWVLDSTFSPVTGFGNDDVPNALNHGTTQSQATKNLPPGDYYIALSNTITTVGVASQPPPFERSPSNVVCNPGIVMNTSGTVFTAANMKFAITDGSGATTAFSFAKVNGFDVVWSKFTLSTVPTGACCPPSGVCTVTTQDNCTSNLILNGITMGGLNGTFNAGSTCGSITCTQPPNGACCQLDGTCTTTSSYACSSYTGAWRGASSLCSQQPCPGTVTGEGVPFDANTIGGQQFGDFLNITAGPDPILINRIDYYSSLLYNNAILTAAGARNAPCEAVFYARLGFGGYSGFETSTVTNAAICFPPTNSDWVVNTDTGAVISGPGNWVTIPVTLTTPISVPANQIKALYLTSVTGGMGARQNGTTDYAGSDGVMMHGDEGRQMANGLAINGNWGGPLFATTTTFNGRIFYAFTGACCSGAGACIITTAGGCTSGNNFVGLGAACAPNPCAGVCCRGSTCNTTIGLTSCTATGMAGARFVPNVSTCNGTSTIAPCCYADYNKVNGISVQDIFDFLGDWFSGNPFAAPGTNGTSGSLAVQNVFDFLAAWFSGGC